MWNSSSWARANHGFMGFNCDEALDAVEGISAEIYIIILTGCFIGIGVKLLQQQDAVPEMRGNETVYIKISDCSAVFPD